jgi:hypothetical protein
MTHNLQPFKPITYNLSSEKPVSKFALQMQPAALHRGRVGRVGTFHVMMQSKQQLMTASIVHVITIWHPQE